MLGEIDTTAPQTGALSRAAKVRMLARSGEPIFLADWVDVLMVHLEVDPAALQHATPFKLDLFNGRAFGWGDCISGTTRRRVNSTDRSSMRRPAADWTIVAASSLAMRPHLATPDRSTNG